MPVRDSCYALRDEANRRGKTVWEKNLLELAVKRKQEEKNLFFSSCFAVLFCLPFFFL